MVLPEKIRERGEREKRVREKALYAYINIAGLRRFLRYTQPHSTGKLNFVVFCSVNTIIFEI